MEELDDVARILDAAAAWLRVLRIDQWPTRFSPDVIGPAIEAGETFLVTVGGELAGTVTIDLEDPSWADLPAPAVYVHRLAVLRTFAGAGIRILDQVEQLAADDDRSVRLDCVASNSRLCRYYEALGYTGRGEVPVGGGPGQRSTSGTITTVSRFEKVPPSSVAAPGAVGNRAHVDWSSA